MSHHTERIPRFTIEFRKPPRIIPIRVTELCHNRSRCIGRPPVQ
ncbi:Fibrillin-1 precursor (fragment) [Bradyrhizobium sp. ORS 375]